MMRFGRGFCGNVVKGVVKGVVEGVVQVVVKVVSRLWSKEGGTMRDEICGRGREHRTLIPQRRSLDLTGLGSHRLLQVRSL